ncbi:MAG: O-antigen ligase family protein [Caulobacteraceae bacterium]
MERVINNKSLEITAVLIGAVLGILGFIFPLKTLVLAVGGMAGLILVLWKYEIGVYAVVGFIPLAPTSALVGLILLTFISSLLKLYRENNFKFRINPLDVLVILLGTVLIYSSVTSYTVKSSILALLMHIAFIVFYFVLTNTIKTRQQLLSLIALLVMTSSVAALYGLYQYKFGGATSEAWVDTTMFEDIKSRVGSTFDNPNVFGEYLVLIIPVAVAMLWGQKGRFSKLMTMVLAAVMLVCLMVTYSRGAYIGIVLAAGLFAVLRDKRFVVLGIIGLLLLPFILPPSVINRFASIGNLQDTSSSYRISVWLGSLKIVRDFWPSGIGLGLEPFKLIYPKYSLTAAYAFHSHNIYLQLLIETGATGFVLFLGMLLVFYKTTLTNFYKTKDKFLSTFMIAISAGLAGYLVQGLVENIWYNYRVLLSFWVMMALGMIARGIMKKDSGVLRL